MKTEKRPTNRGGEGAQLITPPLVSTLTGWETWDPCLRVFLMPSEKVGDCHVILFQTEHFHSQNPSILSAPLRSYSHDVRYRSNCLSPGSSVATKHGCFHKTHLLIAVRGTARVKGTDFWEMVGWALSRKTILWWPEISPSVTKNLARNPSSYSP